MRFFSGRKTNIQTEPLITKPKCSSNIGDLDPKSDTPIECKGVLFNQTTWFMQDGERYMFLFLHLSFSNPVLILVICL